MPLNITVQITIRGYGGECYMGKIDRKTYEYFKKNEIDIEQLANDFDDDKWDFIPEEHRIFPPGSPYECSDLGHQSGATMDSGSTITVKDQDGNDIWESDLDLKVLQKKGVKINPFDEAVIDSFEPGTVIFWGGQGEKGTFFNGEIQINEPFDPKKLAISYSNLDGWHISSGVEYDGEEVDGSNGYDTVGKWGENKFLIVGDEEVYEGRDRDEEGDLFSDDDTPEGSSNSPQDWEKSRRIKKGNPIRIGWYECNFSYGTTYGSLYWSGSEWQSFRNGRPIKECDTVDWWYGFNWDTSNWNNQPTEPPEVSCKKCNWSGSSEDLLPGPEDLTIELSCPLCKSKNKDIDWINYDPETKKGTENRKKYCV
jgi:hypothetical protein